MKEFFRKCNMRQESRIRVEQCNKIIVDYQSQGLRLTLRQLYYQLVSKNVIPNVEKSYKNLSTLVSDARLAGLMDWDAIEDRVRVARKPGEYEDLEELVDVAVRSFRLPRWREQECYVELWVEKDALAGVLEPIANRYHVTLMVNRGYSSQSAMHDSSKRFRYFSDKECILLYLGDHDPSGEDMVRDIGDRLKMFGATVDVRKLALTMTQINEYNPPPNPAKLTDPRAFKYIEKHGDQSWEVDALPPEVLTSIIEDELDEIVDGDLMDEVKKTEEKEKVLLRKALSSLRG